MATGKKMQRVEELCRNVVPARALAADAPLALKDKKGVEKKYGEFLSKVLGDPRKGMQLCHAMLLPRPESAGKAKEDQKTGKLEFVGARVARPGRAAGVQVGKPANPN